MSKKKTPEPATDIVKAGSVYDTSGRKGAVTIRLLTDVDLRQDTFFDAEIVEGKAQFIARDNAGRGNPGEIISFRTTLTSFMKRRPELENDEDLQAAKMALDATDE